MEDETNKAETRTDCDVFVKFRLEKAGETVHRPGGGNVKLHFFVSGIIDRIYGEKTSTSQSERE